MYVPVTDHPRVVRFLLCDRYRPGRYVWWQCTVGTGSLVGLRVTRLGVGLDDVFTVRTYRETTVYRVELETYKGLGGNYKR